MTKQEFLKAYTKARKSFGNISIATARKIRETYISASNEVAEVIRNAELAGLSSLTTESQRQLNIQLQVAAERIQQSIIGNTLQSMDNGLKLTSNINETYLWEAFKNIEQNTVTEVGLENMFLALNDNVIRSVVNRVFTSGYDFAESVWRIGDYYQDTIKRVVSAGFAQGRDLFKIAKDIQVYVKDGKIKLMNRYGKLVRGTRVFTKRIPKLVDWRAVRLVRSELYMALQDASREQGRINPGCIDLYDWILTAGRQHWNCACEDIQANSPYEYQSVPAYPHSNCRCYIRPVLRDRKQFEDDLVQWVNGQPIEYLNNWYDEFYLPFAA